jgi:transcriptional regulator with XRE-family HTH domain
VAEFRLLPENVQDEILESEREEEQMSITRTLDQMMKEVGPARRRKIERRAAQLIADEMSLRELRRAHKLTQETIAETLGIGQDQVSRLEQRSDLLISTLRGYIEAIGGTLTLLAEFPHRAPVALGGFATLEQGVAEPMPASASRKLPKPDRSRRPRGKNRHRRQTLALTS